MINEHGTKSERWHSAAHEVKHAKVLPNFTDVLKLGSKSSSAAHPDKEH